MWFNGQEHVFLVRDGAPYLVPRQDYDAAMVSDPAELPALPELPTRPQGWFYPGDHHGP
jgi:hypothetical protein